MRTAVIYLSPCIASIFFILACTRDHHDHPNLATAKQLYDYHCAECHGTDGTGKLFDVIPANILTKKSPKGIIDYITTGDSHDRDMPIFRSMNEDEAAKITNHLLWLKEDYHKKKIGRKFRRLMIEP